MIPFDKKISIVNGGTYSYNCLRETLKSRLNVMISRVEREDYCSIGSKQLEELTNIWDALSISQKEEEKKYNDRQLTSNQTDGSYSTRSPR